MLSNVFSSLLIIGLIAFTIYQSVQIVRAIKERKKAKSIEKENIESGRNSDS